MNEKYSRVRKIFFYLIALLLCSVLFLVAGELFTRILWKGKQKLVADERNLNYAFDNELGWFPVKNRVQQFKGGRLINVKNNDDGFRDKNHGVKDKKRIIFLGDSFVWGYDVEADERFTEKLQLLLPSWDILNLGVSGYGTDQEFMLLQKWFDHYHPEIVCLMFCHNDSEDNSTNSAYGYYKPYFELSGDSLIKRGVPVSKSVNYYFRQYPMVFRSAFASLVCSKYLELTSPVHTSVKDPTNKIIEDMKDYAEARGAQFFIAFIDESDMENKRFFCESNKIDFLSVFNNYRYKNKGHHWTPQGHDFVSSKLYDFLVRDQSMSASDSAGRENTRVYEDP